jgi:hypothetical protein
MYSKQQKKQLHRTPELARIGILHKCSLYFADGLPLLLQMLVLQMLLLFLPGM